MRIKPRYFSLMEKLNVKGAPFVGNVASIPAIKLEDLEEDQVLLDVRSKEAYMGGHLEGSYFMALSNLSNYLGTLFTSDTRLVLVTEEPREELIQEVRRQMIRIGFDRLDGYLERGINSLIKSGSSPVGMPSIPGETLQDYAGDFTVLDIRDGEDVPDWLEDKTVRIPLQELYKKYEELDKNRDIYVLCASGNRSTTAASFLVNHGYQAGVILGGIQTL